MGISAPLRASPFFGGSSSVSELVPYVFPVSLDGRPYMLDTAIDAWGFETVPLLRPQSDDSVLPGEQSLNPDGWWRRSWSSWHKGAGQTHRDREESSLFRFRESFGVDVWTRYKLGTLSKIESKNNGGGDNDKLVVCGDRLFLMSESSVLFTEDATVTTAWTACDNEPTGPLLDIATDGRYVWVTDGADIWQADGTATTPDFTVTAWEATDSTVLAYVKGYLLSAKEDGINYHAADGTATAVTLATGSVVGGGFTFTAFCGGPTTPVIYAGGYSGDKSLIFRIGIEEDGSGLDAAIPAAELPDGEIVRALGSYLGFVLIGTDNGVRFATPDAQGNLTVGALLDTGSPCRCFEGQGPFVWFGWDSFTRSDNADTYCGLGRLSLEEFSSTENLAPAYATDLMYPVADGGCLSAVTFGGRTYFTVSGVGVVGLEDPVGITSSAYLDTGLVNFGFAGDKTAVALDVTGRGDSGGFLVQIRSGEGAWATVAPAHVLDGEFDRSYPISGLVGSSFEVRFTYSGDVELDAIALRALPAVEATRKVSLPLLLNENLDPNGGVFYMDVGEERHRLKGFWQSRQPITVHEIGETYTAVVDDLRWVPRMREHPSEGWSADGTMVVTLKEI